MTGTNPMADILLRLEAIEADIRNLYRQRGGKVDERGTAETVFSLPGELTESISPPFFSSPGAVTRSWTASLGKAGTTTTTVVLYRSNVIIASLSLAAGETFARSPLPEITFTSDADSMQVAVSVVGEEAENLTVQVRVSEGRTWTMSEAR